VEAIHETAIWLQLTALAVSPVGTVGAVKSGHAGVVALAVALWADVLFELSIARTV
jgi:hypothetical protein